MRIPRQFTIHNHTIKVIVEDLDKEDNRFGYYDSVQEVIHLFKRVKTDSGEVIQLSAVQLEHSFWHEIKHAFQWHAEGEFDERDAQTFAGLMVELVHSSDLRIDPSVIKEPIQEVYDD